MPESLTQQAFTPRRIGFILAVAIFGMVMFVWTPLVLVPPATAYTGWIYIALLFGWVPVVFWVGRRGTGNNRRVLLIIVGGLLYSFCWCFLFAPGTFATISIGESLISFSDFTCDSVPEKEGETDRYTCVYSSFDSEITYIIEAPSGFPVGRVVETRESRY